MSWIKILSLISKIPGWLRQLKKWLAELSVAKDEKRVIEAIDKAEKEENTDDLRKQLGKNA